MPALRSAIALALIVVSVLASSVFAAGRPTDPADIRWDDRFAMEFSLRFGNPNSGMDSVTTAVVFQGELYVAGRFRDWNEFNSLRTIARWNGRQWKPVGVGSWFNSDHTEGLIMDLVVHEDRLYATGWFTTAAGLAAQNIVSWDGQQWSAVGAGLNGPGTALASYGGDLYVAGDFTQAGGQAARNVARWDGTDWHAVGAGLENGPNQPNTVGLRSLLATPQGLYAGGDFARSGNQELHTLARWDGSQWSAPIPDLRGVAVSLAWHNGALYIGGMVSHSLGGDIPNQGGLLRWDGTQGQFLTDGLEPGAYVSTVRSIAGDLYVSARENLYRWDGAAWQPFGLTLADAGHSSRIMDIISYNTTLHLVGTMECLPADCTAKYVLAWTGATWNGLGEGVFGQGVSDMAVMGDALYASSESSRQILGSQWSHNLGRWDAAGWHDVSIGANTAVTSLLPVGSSLYAAKVVYNSSTSSYTSTIARLDAGVWTTLPGVFNGIVNTLAYTDGALYAGGGFSAVGAVQARAVARWDGAAWAALGDPLLYEVKDLAVHGGAVYVASAASPNQNYAAEVSRWDGSAWTVLGTAIDTIEAIAVTADGDLYIAGRINLINNVPATLAARWRAGAWEALPHDFTASASVGPYQPGAYALEIGADGALYLGGIFASAGTPGMKNIARYDGTWTPLGSGVDGAVLDLEASGEDLYVGGLLFRAGDNSSANIAIWHGGNLLPLAAADTATTTRGQAVDIAVLGNDSDPDQDGLTISSVTTPGHGGVQVVGGMVRYTPAAGFVGSDSFSYTISDGGGGTASASVMVTVVEPTSVIFLPAVVR